MRKSPRLCVFISSRMAELQYERKLVRSALDELNVDAWIFEKDAGARPESTKETFLTELGKADLYIGIFWKGFGIYTIEEYEHAVKLGKDILIYEKRLEIENDRDPDLEAFLNRARNVETGHTIQWFNTPEELVQYIKSDINARLVETYRKKTSRHPKANFVLSLAEEKERNSQLNLLHRVQSSWIDGVLKQSLHSEAQIILGKQQWNAADKNPWRQIIELPDQSQVPVEQSNIDTFDQSGRSLLILGEPGSGKTMTLLDLAQELIKQAESDPSKAIPVVLNLSSWLSKRESIFDWLVEELNSKYQIPEKAGKKWLNEFSIIPLLDGLDEVKAENRSDCVTAINTYISKNMLPGIIVTSRLDEYKSLSERLQLSRTIRLQPLTSEQVDEYISRSGKKLDGLRQVLKSDRSLKSLTATPLMLDVMSIAYNDVTAESLSDVNLNTPQVWRKHIFDAYVDKMFKRKGQREQPYSQEKMMKWLAWFANGMQRQNLAIFFVHQLNPDWFKSKEEKQKFSVIHALLSFFFGLTIRPIFTGPISLIFLFFLGPKIQDPLNQTSDVNDLVLHWSRKETFASISRSFLKPLLLGILFILLFLFLYNKGHPVQPLTFGLFLAAYIVLNAMFAALFKGLKKEPLKTELVQQMNNIIMRNFLMLAVGGFICGIIIGLVLSGLIGSLIPEYSLLLIVGFAFFCGVFTVFALLMWYSGPFALQNIAMLSSIYFIGRGPFNYFVFLEYATQLLFLRKVGIGYIFIHRLLLEYFAGTEKKS